MSGKRRKYTPDFREQAARLVIETGRPTAASDTPTADSVLVARRAVVDDEAMSTREFRDDDARPAFICLT